MEILIIAVTLSLGLNISQIFSLNRCKRDKSNIFLQLKHEKDHAEISKSVIANLLKKVDEINKKYTDLRSDKSTDVIIEDVPAKKTRTKK